MYFKLIDGTADPVEYRWGYLVIGLAKSDFSQRWA